MRAFLLLSGATCGLWAQVPAPEFITLASARPVLQAMRASLPKELKAGPAIEEAAWNEWVRSEDRAVRERVAQGEELTLSNLLRLGVTYTKERRIDYGLLSRYGRDAAITAVVERRAADLIRTLAAPKSEGMTDMRALLKQEGYSVDTPEAQAKTRAYLLALVAQQRDDVALENAAAKTDVSQVFKDRGLSTDSDLYTAYALELHFKNLAAHGLLKPGSVRRVAIIGPGLDYVNKKNGYDFYPPQVIQPYAVIDSLARLGLADAATVTVVTFDISARVNQHIERARARAAAGTPYTIQLLWSRSTGGSTGFLIDFGAYWRTIGDRIGKAADPVPVPASAQGDVTARAVAIRPAIAAHVSPVDMNVIFQAPPLAADQRFDLVIGTNIFLYYDDFQQALARVNLAAMIRPGGAVVSNTPLSAGRASKLADAVRTEIPVRQGLMDYVYSYVRQP